ncbi:MAG: hypothetical protein PWQ93_1455 [Clostridiales bacterium]|nr:hypothetical protein [Clostridiales bacterium]
MFYPPYSPGYPGQNPCYPGPGMPYPPCGDQRRLMMQAMDIFMRNEPLMKQMHEKIHAMMQKPELANDATFQDMMMHFREMGDYGNKTAGYIAALLCKSPGGYMPPSDWYYPPMSPHDCSHMCIDEMMKNYVQPMDEHHQAVKADIESLKGNPRFSQNSDFMEFVSLFEQHDALSQQLMNILNQLAGGTMPPMYPPPGAMPPNNMPPMYPPPGAMPPMYPPSDMGYMGY